MTWNLALLARRRAFSGRYREGPCRGTDRALGHPGWYRAREGVFRPQDHPLRPLQGLRGPLRCPGTSLKRAVAGWVVPRYSPPGTHPVYPPGMYPARTWTLPTSAYPKVGHCSDSRFWDTVGEPRGMETHPVFRVPDWLYTVFSLKAGLHGRLTGFSTVL